MMKPENLYKDGRSIVLMALLITLSACNGDTGPVTAEEVQKKENPAAEGFNMKISDPEAIALADKVMQSMGGRKTWDTSRYFHWQFFDRREWYWNKQSGMARVDFIGQDTTIILNVDNKQGKVFVKDTLVADTERLNSMLDLGYKLWVNDMYWLFMPFKLKDSGVTLKYLGEKQTSKGQAAEVVQLTFEEVGVTPQNKYWMYIDTSRHLITEWAFFSNRMQEEPNFQALMDDYKNYNGLLLSGDRGVAKLPDIAVYNSLPDSVFETPYELDYRQYLN